MKAITIGKSITKRDTASLNLYFKDVAKTAPLDPEEEVDLIIAAQNGDEKAREKVIVANTRFVISVAKQYQWKGLPLEDLISEGNIGLMTALNMFDPTKGLKFISYAVWWIRQSILKAIYSNNSSIRLPASQIDPLRKVRKVTEQYLQKEQRPPTVDEIVQETGLDREKVRNLDKVGNLCISISTTLNADEDLSIEDTLSSDMVDLDKGLDNSELPVIDRLLNTLSDRDHDILCMMYGLLGVKKLSFDEIGRKFAITGERVRQIKEIILNNIRNNKKELFRKYFEEMQ